nr:angiopoietin-related protein 6-like isoform X3 [Zootoca vivipara]
MKYSMEPQYLVVLVLSLARPGLSGVEPLTGPKCTYTFILPQQKFTGAVCWSSLRLPPEPPGLNRSEVAELRDQLNHQQAQMEELRRLVEVDGAVPPLVPVVPHNPASIANESRVRFDAVNDIQRDQMVPAQHQPQKAADMPQDGTVQPPAVVSTKSTGPWRDCQAAQQNGQTSGITILQPTGARGIIQTWCDQEYDGGGWTVIQRRQDGSVNFFITWQHYKNGFGNLEGEHWLGLEFIHWLTRQGSYVLRVSMEDWSGRQAYAEYSTFALEPESDFYRLRLGRYQGSAGDSLSWHNGRQFSTLDRDHDAYSGNCAHFQKGGWWYNMCAHSNLNGVWYKGGHYRSRYQDGVYWAEFRGGAYSLRKVVMMIRSPQGT